ncbi:MAG: BrnA antitoxin family protein [Candidatus Omnitrophica bacterium]|nr:BrnA antitoxin family protein [Candidatus Omnitrophota bacterium]MBU4590600.1 BrnA antitoxin family protein [Candidatus Omnitrophota bacterium]
MRKDKIDPDMPIGKLTRVKDFLPPPEKLVFPKATVKITISLSRASVEFFKHQAKEQHVKYQQMIRELLDRYVTHYSYE